MAHVAVNGIGLRPSGGTQVISGLLSRLSSDNRYSVLVNDPAAYETVQRIVGPRSHITYIDPVGRANNAAGFFWNMRRLSGWLRANGADCVLGVNHHFPSGGVPQITYHLNVLRFERPRRPVYRPEEIADRLRDWRAGLAVRRSDVNLFESHLLFDLARARHGEIANGRVLYIGIEDRDEVLPPVGEPEPLLLLVTSSQPHKDNATVVQALEHLIRSRPEVPWRLVIAGGRTPSAFDPLRALIAELGLKDRVEFLGFRPHDEIARIGGRALCLVSASLAESFCMVALEAMAWGCPSVVADASSMPESIGDAGLLARPSDPRDFAAQILRLWDDRTLRSGLIEKGIARAASMTWRTAASELEDLIASATPR